MVRLSTTQHSLILTTKTAALRCFCYRFAGNRDGVRRRSLSSHLFSRLEVTTVNHRLLLIRLKIHSRETDVLFSVLLVSSFLAMAFKRPLKRVRFANDLGSEEDQVAVTGNLSTARPSDKEFEYIKRVKTDQFSEWRRGYYDWVESSRQAEIKTVVHPKSGAWDPWDLIDHAAVGALEAIRHNRRSYRNPNRGKAMIQALRNKDPIVDARLRLADDAANERLRPLGFFGPFGPGSTKVRRLGFGSNGVTFLFSMESPDRTMHNVVVKLDVRRRSEAIKKEIAVLKVRSYLGYL